MFHVFSPVCFLIYGVKSRSGHDGSQSFDKKNNNFNKNIKVVKLEILKVKTWFWNKDLSSLDSIN